MKCKKTSRKEISDFTKRFESNKYEHNGENN